MMGMNHGVVSCIPIAFTYMTMVEKLVHLNKYGYWMIRRVQKNRLRTLPHQKQNSSGDGGGFDDVAQGVPSARTDREAGEQLRRDYYGLLSFAHNCRDLGVTLDATMDAIRQECGKDLADICKKTARREFAS